jgi:hypothetical protein
MRDKYHSAGYFVNVGKNSGTTSQTITRMTRSTIFGSWKQGGKYQR